MPDFSSRPSGSLGPHRSSRSLSSAAKSRNHSHSPYPAPSSRPSSRQRALEQDIDVERDHTDVDTTCGGAAGQPSLALPPIASVLMPKSISPDLVAPTAISVSPVSNSTDSTQVLHPSDLLATSLQPSLVVERQRPPSSKDLTSSASQHQGQGIFKNASNFSVVGSNFIEKTDITNNINVSSQFMKDFLKETIPGAAADSSARDPPPRCHPGTRLAILERCLHFIAHCEKSKKTRWVVGGAGVGKSAIMQSITESPKLSVDHRASVFLSINGRDEGTKTIITLSYQFAAKSQSYRWVIEDEINRDPSLLQSSMAVQFERFIVQPFIYNSDTSSTGRVLIIVDGLDECKDIRTQVELLRLISGFCISYPSSPIAWLIASRPEPHIISFFARPEVSPTYEKEEIAVDSNEARADVERFLRYELAEIGRASNSLDPCWPDEQQLWKLANAAGGLFAYAQTVVRYISDSNVCDPASQLIDVLNVIDELPLSHLSQEDHPMALLDALYARVLSNVPPRIMFNARKLLLAVSSGWDLTTGGWYNLIVLCNWLGMTANEAYTALNRLRAVLDFPERHEAHQRAPEPFHKSFIDYIHRSEFSSDITLEARQIMVDCALRVLKEAPNGYDFDTPDDSFYYGILAPCSGAGDQLSFSWPAQDGIDWNDAQTRQSMYHLAIGQVVQGIERADPVFQTKPYIELLTTRFNFHNPRFPFNKLCDVMFDTSRRDEFLQHGILKQIPANKIPVFSIYDLFSSKMRFRRPVTAKVLPNVWESSCSHERDGQYKQEEEQNWTTTFEWGACTFCSDRLRRQLKSFVAHSPDYAVPIMFTSSDKCWIEVGFVDPEDGVSEWTYWLPLFIDWSERKELGSTI